VLFLLRCNSSSLASHSQKVCTVAMASICVCACLERCTSIAEALQCRSGTEPGLRAKTDDIRKEGAIGWGRGMYCTSHNTLQSMRQGRENLIEQSLHRLGRGTGALMSYLMMMLAGGQRGRGEKKL
jgi:hypothetical protein